MIPASAPWSSSSLAFSWLRTTPTSGRTMIDCAGNLARMWVWVSGVEEKGMKSVFTHRYLYALLPKCSNTFCHLSSVLQLSLEIDFFLSRCSWRNESMEWPRKRTCTVINLSFMHKFLQGLVLLAILVGSVFAGPAIVRHGLQPISFRKPVHDSSVDFCVLCVQFSQESLNELVYITTRKTVIESILLLGA